MPTETDGLFVCACHSIWAFLEQVEERILQRKETLTENAWSLFILRQISIIPDLKWQRYGMGRGVKIPGTLEVRLYCELFSKLKKTPQCLPKMLLSHSSDIWLDHRRYNIYLEKDK